MNFDLGSLFNSYLGQNPQGGPLGVDQTSPMWQKVGNAIIQNRMNGGSLSGMANNLIGMGLAQYMKQMYPSSNPGIANPITGQAPSDNAYSPPTDNNNYNFSITGRPDTRGKIRGLLSSYTGGLLFNGRPNQDSIS